MNPEVDKVLQGFSGTLIGKVMPHVGQEYVQRDVTLLALALTACAEEYDRAAEVRFAENKDMRSLFSMAAESVSNADLSARLRAAAESSDESLRVSVLNKENTRLRELLIELHTHVENTEEVSARDIEKNIWRVLRSSTERRALSFFPF